MGWRHSRTSAGWPGSSNCASERSMEQPVEQSLRGKQGSLGESEAKAWQATIHRRPAAGMRGSHACTPPTRPSLARNPPPSHRAPRPCRRAAQLQINQPATQALVAQFGQSPSERSTHLLNTVDAGAQILTLSCAWFRIATSALAIVAPTPTVRSGQVRSCRICEEATPTAIVSCPLKRGPPAQWTWGHRPFHESWRPSSLGRNRSLSTLPPRPDKSGSLHAITTTRALPLLPFSP